MMPNHEQYAEPFIGSGAVARYKRPAKLQWGFDLDSKVVATWEGNPDILVKCECGIKALQRILMNRAKWGHAPLLVYADPPYVRSTRKSRKALYRFEMDNSDHKRLLKVLLALANKPNVAVMLSGYRSEMYDRALSSWFSVDFQAQTRGGPATETVWMNFDPDQIMPHDLSFQGDNFTRRQMLRRKVLRYKSKFAGMSRAERLAILHEVSISFPEEYEHASDLA